MKCNLKGMFSHTPPLLRCFTAVLIVLIFSNTSLNAQYLLNSDSAFKAGAANSGRLWGYAFGDYYYKSHSDSVGRGNSNQYTGIPQSRNEFQMRRIYLGYDYNISKTFTAELLLAAEDNITTGGGTTSGDLLSDNKFTFYIKLANIRWKNIWKGADLVVGQVSTPAFPLLSEKIWNYRSIERTIADIRRTPSYDFGATLQGTFDPATKNFGYNVMMGNGTSAKPETDNYKWFYGDIWGKFFNQHLVVDLYADYERMKWVPGTHNVRQMLKGFVAYTTPALTVGLEGFVNNMQDDITATRIDGTGSDLLSAQAKGLSFYVHGDVVKDKLRFFARVDSYNPNNRVDNSKYKSYIGNTGNYSNKAEGTTTSVATPVDITTKQTFFTAGLDFTPAKNVHFMPNVWYNHYKTQLSGLNGGWNGDYDLVYRMTFFYTFGK